MKIYSFLLAFIMCSNGLAAQPPKNTEYYLTKIYHCSDLQQIAKIEKYLQQEMIPFLHNNGIQLTGVFTPLANDTASDKQLYVWIPFTRLEMLASIEHRFGNLDPYGKSGLIHLDSMGSKAPYVRIETMLAEAFKKMKQHYPAVSFKRSPGNIYEFRSYESSTENLHLRKVHMFNEGGEIDLFKKLNFNALFYARVIVGAHMPNLIYITRFTDIADRDEHWKKFGNSPDWKKMSSLAQYASTVSKHEVVLLKASACSEF